MTVEATTGGCGCAGGGRKKNGKGHTKKHMMKCGKRKVKTGKKVSKPKTLKKKN
jgi:hypothetical protein